MPKFIDFHPDWQVNTQTVEKLREATKTGKTDQFGVRQVEFFYNPDGKGAYCVLVDCHSGSEG